MNRLSAYDYALNLLTARPYATRALHKKLIQKEYRAADADDAIRRLVDNGLLGDEKFAEQYARSKILSTGASKRRLTQDLYRKGIKGDVAATCARTLLMARPPNARPPHEVHLYWNLDDTDVDLYVKESGLFGAEVSYQNKRSGSGGELLWDNTAGLGPEIYTHPKNEPAEVFVHYFGTRSVEGTVPSATLVVYFRGAEVICRSAVLADQRDKVVLYSATKD